MQKVNIKIKMENYYLHFYIFTTEYQSIHIDICTYVRFISM